MNRTASKRAYYRYVQACPTEKAPDRVNQRIKLQRQVHLRRSWRRITTFLLFGVQPLAIAYWLGHMDERESLMNTKAISQIGGKKVMLYGQQDTPPILRADTGGTIAALHFAACSVHDCRQPAIFKRSPLSRGMLRPSSWYGACFQVSRDSVLSCPLIVSPCPLIISPDP